MMVPGNYACLLLMLLNPDVFFLASIPIIDHVSDPLSQVFGTLLLLLISPLVAHLTVTTLKIINYFFFHRCFP